MRNILIFLIFILLMGAGLYFTFKYTTQEIGYCQYENWEARNFNTSYCYERAKIIYPFDRDMRCKHEGWEKPELCKGIER